jgi:hypothetical protein
VEVSAGTAQASLPLTFGQPFRAGDLPSSSGLIATDSNGASVPVQMDEVSSHTDGSVRFAVLSTQLSNLQASQPRIVNLFKAAKSTSTPSVPANPAWNLTVEADLTNPDGSVTTYTARPQALLQAQIASGAGKRLSGAVANEYTLVTPFVSASNVTHPHLVARIHVRLYDNGNRIRSEVVMENARTFVSGPGNLTYAMRIKQGSTTLHSQPKFTHYHHARWRKVVWTGSATPNFRVRHNMPYFMASRIIPNYNLGVKIPETALAATATSLANADTSPMGAVFILPYFPTTGGRADIGPVPEWTARYLLSQDDRARAAMMANADAAGAVPIHYRDETKGDHPLSLEDHPNVTLRFGTSSPALPATSGSTPFTPDTPHQPSLTYVPYLLTGDAYYLEEMMFWASYNVAIHNPSNRGYNLGLVYSDEIRGGAWTMRSLGEIAFAIPDAHPRKSYYRGLLANNLDWYAANYVPGQKLSPLGAIPKTHEVDKLTGPWQNDFMGIVIAHLAGNNEPKAATVLSNISKFNVGRFQNQANGYCVSQAASSYLDLDNASGVMLSTWRDFYSFNFGSKACATTADPNQGYPTYAGGHAAVARAMLAMASNAGISGAKDSYSQWKSMTPQMDAEYPNEPTWAIVPFN